MAEVSGSWAADELGLAKVTFLQVCPGVEAVVVIDNVALGPAIGGVRVRPDVTASEVARLARAMTVKNAVAGLPHGGGKSGIRALPGLADVDHERVMRAFARAIEQLTDYIPGPDMGTSETSMAYVHDEIGRLPAGLVTAVTTRSPACSLHGTPLARQRPQTAAPPGPSPGFRNKH